VIYARQLVFGENSECVPDRGSARIIRTPAVLATHHGSSKQATRPHVYAQALGVRARICRAGARSCYQADLTSNCA
jgi:hypothetical protein